MQQDRAWHDESRGQHIGIAVEPDDGTYHYSIVAVTMGDFLTLSSGQLDVLDARMGPSGSRGVSLTTSIEVSTLTRLVDNMEKVERGEEPMGLVRDAAKNTPYISFRRERESKKMLQSGYVPGDDRSDRFAWATAESGAPAAK